MVHRHDPAQAHPRVALVHLKLPALLLVPLRQRDQPAHLVIGQSDSLPHQPCEVSADLHLEVGALGRAVEGPLSWPLRRRQGTLRTLSGANLRSEQQRSQKQAGPSG